MPIGAAKLGVLGAGLVPGGTETFNAPGTFSIPPGVKKVSITGRGGTGNPGVAGNAGNPGNPGTGGAGGGGGASKRANTVFPESTPGPAVGSGGHALRAEICPTYKHPSSTIMLGGPNPNSGTIRTIPAPAAAAIASIGGLAAPRCAGSTGQAGQGGISGNAGTAGTGGSAGNPGQPSSGLGNTFPGGAGGNAPPGGAAGNAGTGGGGGGGGQSFVCGPNCPSFPDPAYTRQGGTGGTGGGNGGQGLGGVWNCGNPLYPQVSPAPPDKNFRIFGGGGGAGAGSVNSGQSGQSTSNTIFRLPSFPCIINTPYKVSLGGTGNITGNLPTDPDVIPHKPGMNPSTMGGGGSFFPSMPGPGSTGGTANYLAWCSQIDHLMSFPPASNIPVNQAGRSAIPQFSPVPNVPGDLFRAGGGGATGFGLTVVGNTNMRLGGGGGGGGRGNAGNAGGPSPTVTGTAGTPQTFNCVTVTPGGTTPITVGTPGGQIVISWNPQ